MKIKGGVFLILGIFLISFVSASFSIGNLSHFIETQYSPSEKISGWINISLKDEPSDSLINDSNGKSITLLNLLKGNGNLEYSCNTQDCVNDYALDGDGKSEMGFSLNLNQKKMIGVKLNGKVNSISSFNLTLTSNAPPSCYSQVKIDILNDDSIDSINEKADPISSCSYLLNRGCFNPSEISNLYSIGKFPNKHCQKINFYSSPGFLIGAWVNNQTSDPRSITMALYDLNMGEITGMKCKLPPVVGSGDASCKINYLVKEPTPYYVCIYSDKTGTSKVKGYSDKTTGCGFYQESETNPEENAAFNIFAQGLGFDTVGEMKISLSYETRSKIRDYIYDIYGSYDCGDNGCIIPISINSQKNQEITLKNLKLEYVTEMGPTETNKLYFVKEIPQK